MNEEKIEESLKELEKKFPLAEDLKLAFPLAVLGGIAGLGSSFMYPYGVPELVKTIHEKKIESFSSFMFCSSATIGYLGGLSSIGYLLVEYGNKPQAWIPIATNLISGIARYAYKKGKEKNFNQNSKSQGGLEKKVAEA